MSGGPDPAVRQRINEALRAPVDKRLKAIRDGVAGYRDRFQETGDTAAAERQRLRDDPPGLLLTTPESLAVLLSQPGLGLALGNLSALVIDEVHALAGNKRGADLAVSLERLTELAGRDVRRVGLSATATPLTVAARWLVGPGRGCAVARTEAATPPQFTIEPLPEGSRLVRGLDRLLFGGP